MEANLNPAKFAHKLQNARHRELGKLLGQYPGHALHFTVHPDFLYLEEYHKILIHPLKISANHPDSIVVACNRANTRSLLRDYGCRNCESLAIIESGSGGIPPAQESAIGGLLAQAKRKVVVFTGLFKSACIAECAASVKALLEKIGRKDVILVVNRHLAKDLSDLH